MADDVKKPTVATPSSPFGGYVMKYGWIVVLLVMAAQQFHLIGDEDAERIKKGIQDISQREQVQPPPVPVPDPAPLPPPVPDVQPTPAPMTPEQIAEMIRKAVDEARKKPEPKVADDVTPAPIPHPVESVRIRVCDDQGGEITGTEVAAGQLFRVSAVGVGDSIGWHPVKSGEVRLSASTDGKEYCGYLTAGQWVEFSLTDFASKTQASLRVTCLTAPKPPPIPDEDRTQPKPEPKAKNVRLFVVHNPNKITPDNAIVLNANDMWDAFTTAGTDWKFVDVGSDDEDERRVIADAAGVGLPAVVIYDKATGQKLAAEELPKSVIATEGMVERFTGGK